MAIELLEAFEREPPVPDFVWLGTRVRMKLRTAMSWRWPHKVSPPRSAASCKGQQWFIAGARNKRFSPPALIRLTA